MRRPLIAVWTLAIATIACNDPARPLFPGADLDSLGPEIEVVSPPPDTAVTRPDVLVITVVIRDQSPVDSVVASVSGVLAFAFPPYAINDTLFQIQFPIPTESAAPGAGSIAIDAVDRLRNRTVKNLTFVVQ